MQRRIDLPSALVLLGSLLLLISLFVSWWAESNAWEAFEALDLILLGLAIGAALAAVGRLGDPDDARPAMALAVVALVVVAVQLLEPPPGFGDDEKEAGVWLALLATLLMTVGAALMVASINVVLDVQGRERRPRVAAVDRREAATTVVPASATAGPSPASSPVRGEEDDEAHPADGLFRGGDASASSPVAGADDEDDRTKPMRPLPPDA